MRPCVFLDRDGVLIEDVDLLTSVDDVRVLPGVPQTLARLRSRGFVLVVVSNQTVVARGMATEPDVTGIHTLLGRQLEQEAAGIDAWYFCPHHPHANVPDYRQDCECRKPRPGMLLRAQRDLEIDLQRSFMVGDRLSDVQAGAAAGCRTILVQTGKHLAPPIVGMGETYNSVRPDHTCADLAEAGQWILGGK
jgi:D-glycero-D-manno-heptose 1,7-bisphosphate phosphatase